jgi:hypothetical protein
MPYEHRWYVERRIIYSKVWGDQDIDELTRSSSEVQSMMEQGIPLVHMLMDDSQLGKVPVNLSQLMKAISGRHANLGWVIMIGQGSRIPNFLMDMLTKIFRSNVRREPTLEKAVEFLKGTDITIPWTEDDNHSIPSK